MSSEAKLSAISADRATDAGAKTVFKVLLAISFCHLLNDTVQSLLPAIYPLLRDTFHLDFGQIGLISFTSTFTASLLQPLVGTFVLPRGQRSIAWFSFLALLGMILLVDIGAWTKKRRAAQAELGTAPLAAHVMPMHVEPHARLPRKKILWSLAVLVTLMFSKFFYLASLGSYYTFYLMDRFHVSIRSAEFHLFAFLGAVAAGTFFGGPVGDRMGRKVVIWYSILGVLPFTLLLPYANLFWTGILSVVIGLILASAFSTILVFAQELVPGKVGTVSGFFFGLAFGLGGIGAALLGKLADATSIRFVYHVCSFLPAVGILTAFLPNLNPVERKGER